MISLEEQSGTDGVVKSHYGHGKEYGFYSKFSHFVNRLSTTSYVILAWLGKWQAAISGNQNQSIFKGRASKSC